MLIEKCKFWTVFMIICLNISFWANGCKMAPKKPEHKIKFQLILIFYDKFALQYTQNSIKNTWLTIC